MDPMILPWTCEVCGYQMVGDFEALTVHLRTHGFEPQRWPDGELVVDMSNVPELLEER